MKLPKFNWKNKTLWETLALYILLLLVYHFTQKNMPLREYGLMARQAIIPVLGIYFAQYARQTKLLSFQWIPALCIGFCWIMIIPFLKHFSLAGVYRWNPREDILFGTYLMLLFMSLEGLYAVLCSKLSPLFVKIISTILTLITLIAFIIPSMEVGHFGLYHVTVSDSSIYAMQLTYPKEVIGYIQSYASPLMLGVGTVIIVGLGNLLYRIYRSVPPLSIMKKSIILIFLVPLVLIYLMGNLGKKELFFAGWERVYHYRQAQNLFTKDYQQRYDGLQLSPTATLAQTNPGTVIVVIGESASRDYMKVYNPDFPYDDTPWLDSKQQDPGFILYHNVYSSYNQTVESLIKACTEMSQYNDKKFNQSITMIDVAKKAGYKTYWLSSQGGIGQNDAPITLIMKTADYYESLPASGHFKYDEELLPFLETIGKDKTPNKFIVIHLKGSHGPYQARYPENAAKFDSNTLAGRYANSVLYTDTILKKIFKYAQQNMDLKMMLYFSDHGDNLEHGHGPDVRTFDTLRIPMFLYLSPDYQQVYPQRTDLLKKRAADYFTNDMVYNTLCGILNAPSNHYDDKEDFSSPAYSFTRNTLWTFKHTVPISDDPT